MREDFTMTGIRNVTWTPDRQFTCFGTSLCRPDDTTLPPASLITFTLCGVVRDQRDPRYGDAEYLLYVQEMGKVTGMPQVKAGRRPTIAQINDVTPKQHPQHGCVLIPAKILTAYGEVWGKYAGEDEEQVMIEREEIVPLVMHVGAIDVGHSRGGYATTQLSVEYTTLGIWEDAYMDMINFKQEMDDETGIMSKLYDLIEGITGEKPRDPIHHATEALTAALAEMGGPMITEMLLAYTDDSPVSSATMRLMQGGITLIPPHPTLAAALVERVRTAIQAEYADWETGLSMAMIYGAGDEDALKILSHSLPLALSALAYKAYTLPTVASVLEDGSVADGKEDYMKGLAGVDMRALHEGEEPRPDSTVRHTSADETSPFDDDDDLPPAPVTTMGEDEELASLKETWGAVWDE